MTTPGGLEIPRKDAEVEEFVKEMVNIAKVLEERKDSGEKVYRYRKLGDDHYRHALNYLMLAAKRIMAIVPKTGVAVPAESEGYYF